MSRLPRATLRPTYLFAAAILGFSAGTTYHAWPRTSHGHVDIGKMWRWPLRQVKQATSPAQRQHYLQSMKQKLHDFDKTVETCQKTLGLDRERLQKVFGFQRAASPTSESSPASKSRLIADEETLRRWEQSDINREEYQRRKEEREARRPSKATEEARAAAREIWRRTEPPVPDEKWLRRMEQIDVDDEERERRRKEREGRRKGK